GRPLAFLYTVARNLCIDTFRRKNKEEQDTESVQPGFEERIVNSIALHEAIESLSIEEQELLFLRYVNEVPFAVLSNMYGKSRFVLYRELNKITKKLERRISDGT
ncbi:sigma-70 family RNA polymerase sigma factor, partial [Anaerosporobacter sp.]